jgi:hypothetical protein
MTELIAEGLNDAPTLSRAERRKLEEASGKKQPVRTVEDEVIIDEPDDNDENGPTREYAISHGKPAEAKSDKAATKIHKPVKAAKLSKQPVVIDDEEEDEEEEIEEIEEPVRTRGKKKPAPVVIDDEDEDEDEEEYEDEEDDEEEYENTRAYKGKKRAVYEDDEDDDDDDDDDDYEDEDEEEVSFIHRVFGFFKGLLGIVLILLLTVLALRVAEASGRVDLDSFRDMVGDSVPFVETIFPDPNPNN